MWDSNTVNYVLLVYAVMATFLLMKPWLFRRKPIVESVPDGSEPEVGEIEKRIQMAIFNELEKIDAEKKALREKFYKEIAIAAGVNRGKSVESNTTTTAN